MVQYMVWDSQKWGSRGTNGLICRYSSCTVNTILGEVAPVHLKFVFDYRVVHFLNIHEYAEIGGMIVPR